MDVGVGYHSFYQVLHKMKNILIPTEEQEQNAIAQFLDIIGVDWCHVPNGGHRNKIVGAKLKAQGVKRGVPDILIFTPPSCGGYVGVAIELKKIKGGKTSKEQKEWLSMLKKYGWHTSVCKGSGEAIDLIKKLGYP